MRYAVQATHCEVSTLREEIENIKRYLAIQQLRFGEKLRYSIEVEPECWRCMVPTMLLQPLFENAVKHGVYESTETVNIAAKIMHKNAQLYIYLSNEYDPANSAVRKGSGSGLRNATERLRLLYGEDASLQVKKNGGSFVVAIAMPIRY